MDIERNRCGKVRLDPTENTVADQNGVRFTITGLSGITYLGASNYVAVMDNSNHLVAFALAFDQQGHITAHKVTGGYTLDVVRDYEGIAYTKEGDERLVSKHQGIFHINVNEEEGDTGKPAAKPESTAGKPPASGKNE